MRRLLLLAHMLLLSGTAYAAPMTLTEFRDEFLGREIESIRLAYIDNHPVMTAEFLGQGFDAVLRECTPIDKSCEAARLTACRDVPGYERVEVLEFANRLNMGYGAGTAYAAPEMQGPRMCLKLQFTFRGDDTFGLRQIFIWKDSLEDFINAVDEDINNKLAADVRALITQ